MAGLKRLFNRTIFLLCFAAFFSTAILFAAESPSSGDGGDILLMGLDAYKKEDWAKASLLLKDAVNAGKDVSDNTWYMMIMSQIYAGYYESALDDCAAFERLFPDSPVKQSLDYQKGRVLHLLGRNTEAFNVLADFCVKNPKSPMYVSALFWLAECFFDECDYASAKSLYSQIVSEYPSDPKSADSAARLEEITRSERERKLLYLLKLTGEEYLSLKEDYDRLLKAYGQGIDASDAEFIRKIILSAQENGIGIDESKLKRLNEKLNLYKK